MIQKLKVAYRTYQWVRIAVSVSLLLSGILLYSLAGGFPPPAWGLAATVLPQIPDLWARNGVNVLLPLVGLMLISTSLLILWILLVVAAIKTATYWWQNVYGRQDFSRDLEEAELMAERMAVREREADARLDQVITAWQPQSLMFAPAVATPQASAVARASQFVGNVRATAGVKPSGEGGIKGIARARGGVGFAGPAEQTNAMVAHSTALLPEMPPTVPVAPSPLVQPSTSARSGLYIVPRPHEEVEDHRDDTFPDVKRKGELADIDQRPTMPGKDDEEEQASAVQETPLRLVVGMGLDPGIARKNSPNEDNLFAIQGVRDGKEGQQPVGLFVIADGMGGHANGQMASRMAIQAISDVVAPTLLRQEDTDEAFDELLLEGVHRANLGIYQRNRQQERMMGTTMTAALVVGTTAHIVNVGDSRTYRYRPGEGLKQLTRDHSMVARLVEDGVIKRDDIYTHPKRNQIYRCLGEKASVELDASVEPLQTGDVLLLCSDGLWEMVRDPDISRIIATAAPHASRISSMLIQAALDGGGADNISAVVVAVVPK